MKIEIKNRWTIEGVIVLKKLNEAFEKTDEEKFRSLELALYLAEFNLEIAHKAHTSNNAFCPTLYSAYKKAEADYLIIRADCDFDIENYSNIAVKEAEKNCKILGADFSESDLSNVDACNTDFTLACFVSANMSSIKAQNAIFNECVD